MFYIYILYSSTSDKFYVGYSNNYEKRLLEHNTTDRNTYTSKHRPWLFKAVFECGVLEKEAMQIERFIKKLKSRKFLEQLIDPSFKPSGILAQLVRVPKLRD